MSCIEIIKKEEIPDVDELTEKLKQETFDVNLPNGTQLIQHLEKAFTNVYKNGNSYDDLKEKKCELGDETGIRFSFDFKLHPEGVKKMKNVGNTIQSNTVVIQHNCVMYSYAYALTFAVDDEKQGPLCEFRLFPISFTYRHPTSVTKGGVPSTLKQKAPEMMDVKLRIGNVQGTVCLTPEMDGSYKCATLITMESLKNVTKNGVANLHIELTIDESYFHLDEYVELSPKCAKPHANSERILERILGGEKVPKSDWVITVNEGSPSSFHVHGPILSDSSQILRAAIASHMSIGNGELLSMVSHENRFILPKLKSDDIRVLLTFVYQRKYILPSFEAISRVGFVLTHLFRDDICGFFVSWQAELVNKLMGLNRSDFIQTIAECVKAMICVHSCPQGSLLAVYNVALIVAADAWQIGESKKENPKIEKKVKKLIGYDWPLIDEIFELMKDFEEAICGVEKWRIVE